MVEVSLEALVRLPGTRPAWPAEFAQLVAAVEEDPSEGTGWLALADWCGEHGETGLERAARWLGKRDGCGAHNSRPSYQGSPFWSLTTPELPAGVRAVFPSDADRGTLAGLLADLAAALRKLDEETT